MDAMPVGDCRARQGLRCGTLSEQFEELYSHTVRPSIPPEYLLRATLLQAFFTVRSERQLMQQIDYNLLFRWFVGQSIDGAVWDAIVFTKNRDRLLEVGCGAGVSGHVAGASAGEAASIERALLGGRP